MAWDLCSPGTHDWNSAFSGQSLPPDVAMEGDGVWPGSGQAFREVLPAQHPEQPCPQRSGTLMAFVQWTLFQTIAFISTGKLRFWFILLSHTASSSPTQLPVTRSCPSPLVLVLMFPSMWGEQGHILGVPFDSQMGGCFWL